MRSKDADASEKDPALETERSSHDCEILSVKRACQHERHRLVVHHHEDWRLFAAPASSQFRLGKGSRSGWNKIFYGAPLARPSARHLGRAIDTVFAACRNTFATLIAFPNVLDGRGRAGNVPAGCSSAGGGGGAAGRAALSEGSLFHEKCVTTRRYVSAGSRMSARMAAWDEPALVHSVQQVDLPKPSLGAKPLQRDFAAVRPAPPFLILFARSPSRSARASEVRLSLLGHLHKRRSLHYVTQINPYRIGNAFASDHRHHPAGL